MVGNINVSVDDLLLSDIPTVGEFYAIVCVNTTGGNLAQGDKIIEVGVTVLDASYNIVEEHSTLVNPVRKIVPSQYHNITNRMVETAPTFDDINAELLALLHNKILVMYPSYSTILFLNNELVGKKITENNVLNMQEYVKFFHQDITDSFTFVDVLNYFHIPHSDVRPVSERADALRKLLAVFFPVNGNTVAIASETHVPYFNPESDSYEPLFAFWTPYVPDVNS